jgi:hypothetical protein
MSALCLTDLHCPPLRYGGEAPGPGGAGRDFHVDAECGGVFDEVLAVAAVDPHLPDARMVGGDLVEESGAGPRSPARWPR